MESFSGGTMNRENEFTEEKIDSVEKIIREKMSEKKFPGLSIALIDNTELFWSKGYGYKNNVTKEPVEPETVFSVGSLSKPVFAYAALKLCDEGVLSLDTPLSSYLPEPYLSNEPYLDEITGRRVLSHTTGFPNRRPKGRPLKILFKPGERFSYSGEGYVYLGKVIEHLTKEKLADFMMKELLKPLGMENSSYIWEDQYGRGAEAHDNEGNPLGFSVRKTADPAASLYSNVLDYAKFVCEMNRSEGGLLSDPIRTKMVNPQVNIFFTVSWGLGWGLEHTVNDDYFWQWGGIDVKDGGYRSYATGSKKNKLGVVILTNSLKGLSIFEEIVAKALGDEHPVFPDFLSQYMK
jgi:CubicO group peptidase (beta-lactamase class C family)